MTKSNFALAAAAAAAAMSFFAQPAAAAIEYPWCVQYGGRSGGRNCGFVSYEQCMMTARGAGGMCQPNLFYSGPAEPPPRARKRHPSN